MNVILTPTYAQTQLFFN